MSSNTMIQSSWENHPSYLKKLMADGMPTRECFRPTWVLYCQSDDLNNMFMDKYFAWRDWFSRNNITVMMDLLTFTIVFGNEEDLVLFKLTWL